MEEKQRVCGVVEVHFTVDGMTFTTIRGDDGGDYTASLNDEKCGMLKIGQKVEFRPIVESVNFCMIFAVDVKLKK